MVYLTRSAVCDPVLWPQCLHQSGPSDCHGVPFRPYPTRWPCRILPPTRAKTDVESELPAEVENIDRNYCDDFVCTSSPSVEETVKAFAVDVQRCSTWTLSRFAEDVLYKDSYRSFTGKGKYARPGWINLYVSNPKAVVKRMRMEDQDTAVLDWVLTGSINVFPVVLGCKSTIQMNLLTGQIKKHIDEWDASKSSFPSSLAFSASRVAWATNEVSKDTQEQVDQLSQSFGSMDDEDNIYADPTDPTKFFQEDDTTKQDALFFVGFLALLYAMYKTWNFLFTFHG